jgi:DNA-binding response OmpR family regulator
MSHVNKILVIEDEKSLSSIICKKLEIMGVSSSSAGSVEQAEELLKSDGPFDAIWLDHYLLGAKDGLDFVHDLKKTDHKDTPVYVVSNSSSDEKLSTYMRLGIQKYYIKSDHGIEEIANDIIAEINEGDHE